MSLRFLVEAKLDVFEIEDWYRAQRAGLDLEFRSALEATLEAIQRFPDSRTLVHSHFRRALMRRFPYGVFYVIDQSEIAIVAIFHSSRDPRDIRRRLGPE